MPDKSPSAVSGFYDGIFHYYDHVNSFLTFGLDKHWRRAAAAYALGSGPARLLDVCCGTGELSLEIMKLSRGRTAVTGLDLNAAMLSKAREKNPGAEFISGEAGVLPFPDGTFDALTLAFAARNLEASGNDLACYFKEFLRVLKPGGTFVNLETSQPDNRLVRALLHLHAGITTGAVAMVLPKTRTAYEFLSGTIFTFHPPEEFSGIILSSGFSKVEFHPLMLGAIAIHIARK